MTTSDNDSANTALPADAPTSCRSFVVGLAGGSASGKTTFVRALNEELTGRGLRVEVVGMDRYFWRGQGPGPRLTLPSTGEEMADNNHPDSADNARLVADLDVRMAADDAPDVIIVEGLMALHVVPLRERCDLRLFLQLDADMRALRRLLRDMAGGRGTTDPHWIATYYRECARIGHERYVEPSRSHADLIVRGDSDFARTVPLVAACITARILPPA